MKDPWQIHGRRTYLTDLVGESHYRSELETIVGDEREVEFTAELVPETWNAYDSNAVAVYRHGGGQIGHLSAERAARWQYVLLEIDKLGGRITCDAVAGRSRAGAPIGVLLDVSIQGIKAELRRRAPEVAQRLRDEQYTDEEPNTAMQPPSGGVAANTTEAPRAARSSVPAFILVIALLVLIPVAALMIITRTPDTTEVVERPRRAVEASIAPIAKAREVSATAETDDAPVLAPPAEPTPAPPPVKVTTRSPIEQVYVAAGFYYREDCVRPERAVRTPKASAIAQGYRPAPDCYRSGAPATSPTALVKP